MKQAVMSSETVYLILLLLLPVELRDTVPTTVFSLESLNCSAKNSIFGKSVPRV